MSRKSLVVVIVTLLVGVTAGFVASGQSPQPLRPRSPLFDITRGPKPAKKWSYMTLTEIRRNNKDDSCHVYVEGGGKISCSGGWIDAGEQLGMNLAPEHPRENRASYRIDVLNFLGDNGWELASVHKPELDRMVWVFKREQ
jgi:hypothetical protein